MSPSCSLTAFMAAQYWTWASDLNWHSQLRFLFACWWLFLFQLSHQSLNGKSCNAGDFHASLSDYWFQTQSVSRVAVGCPSTCLLSSALEYSLGFAEFSSLNFVKSQIWCDALPTATVEAKSSEILISVRVICPAMDSFELNLSLVSKDQLATLWNRHLS